MKMIGEIYIPDFRQTQQYHAELLKISAPDRFAHPAMNAATRPLFSIGKSLRLLVENYRPRKVTPISTQKSHAHG